MYDLQVCTEQPWRMLRVKVQDFVQVIESPQDKRYWSKLAGNMKLG